VAPVEEDCHIAGWHLIREANGAALHKLQGQRWEPVALLELLTHMCLLVKFVDEFPTMLTGKVQMFQMRELAIEELGL
jgi:hypothetical protein